jgi:hypothetical protein
MALTLIERAEMDIVNIQMVFNIYDLVASGGI